MTLAEGGTAVLDGTRLKTADIDNGAAQLVYTVTNLPAYGVLALNGVALAAGDTFTQADLNAGLVGYAHDSSENFNDSFTFTVSDGEFTLPAAMFAITVTPVNDAPVVIAQSFILYYKAPAGTVVGTVQASDPDAGQSRTFALLGGNGALAIDSTTGVLTVVDRNLLVGSSLSFTVRVTDNGVPSLSSDAMITVLLRTADTAPTFALSDGAGAPVPITANNKATLTLEESTVITATQNGLLVGTLAAADVDEPGVFLPLTMIDNSGAFAFDAATGRLSVADATKLNFEKTKSLSLWFLATDHGLVGRPNPVTAILKLTINLLDRNDAPMLAPTATFYVAENNDAYEFVGWVRATDPDTTAPNKTLSYAIISQYDDADNPVSIFTIDPRWGVLTVPTADALDYEAHSFYTLVVRVTDGGGLYSDQTITVNVLSVNDDGDHDCWRDLGDE